MKRFGIEGSLKSAILVFIIVSILAICWQPLMAVINIAGKSIVGGKGIRTGSGPVVDTLEAKLNYFMAFSGDSIAPDTTKLKTIFGASVHVHSGADITTFTLDSSKATNTFVKGVKETGGTLVSGYLTFTEGTGITITQAGNDFTFANATGGGSYYGWKIPGGSFTTDTTVYLGGYGISVCEVNPASAADTFCVVADTATLYGNVRDIVQDSTWILRPLWKGNISDSAANLVRLAYVQDITGVKHFQDTVQAGMQGTDGIFSIYSDQGATDYKIVFKPHATMTQSTVYLWPANDGDASQFLQSDGAGNLAWATPAGSGNMNTSTYDVAVSGVVDDVDTVGTQIAAALSHRLSIVDIKTSAELFNKIDTTTAKIPTATLADTTVGGAARAMTAVKADSALAFTWGGIKPWHLDSTSANFVFDDAYRGTSGTAESLYVTAKYVSLAYQPLEATLTDIADGTIAENLVNTTNPWADNEIADDITCSNYTTKVMLTDSLWGLRDIVSDSIWVRGGKMITDSAWTNEALPLTKNFGFSLGSDDSIVVQWPYSIHDVSGWIVKSSNISAQANQVCTTTYEIAIPPETPDLDSINFNLRTSSADTLVSGFRVRCFKQSADLGAWSALTATLIAYFTATDAWEHKSIAGTSIGAITGGDKLEIEICVLLDASAIIWHTEPEVYCLHHK